MTKLCALILFALAAAGCEQSTAPTPIPTTPSTVTEGQWTPVLGGSISTSGQTYYSQHGEWVKHGPLVYVSATVTLEQKGTIVGHLEVQGLPFTSAPHHDSSCYFGDFDAAGKPLVWVAGIISSNVRTVWLRHRDSPMASMSSMTGESISDHTAFQMACTYITNE